MGAASFVLITDIMIDACILSACFIFLLCSAHIPGFTGLLVSNLRLCPQAYTFTYVRLSVSGMVLVTIFYGIQMPSEEGPPD